MPESTHQLAAIMFTDIAGYTALMGADESRALVILRKSRELQKASIERHHGKWLKEMGDGVLAQFASAFDAVNAAIEIQRQSLHGLDAKIRIGIHLGDVTIENEDVFGDGVNIASRLQSIADPGGIYISGSVNDAVHSHATIQTQFLAELRLKNVSRPVRTFAVMGEGLPVPGQARINRLSGKRNRASVIYGAVVALLIVALSIAWWLSMDDSREIRSIAVLPVANLSGDTSLNILTAGIHGELRDELAKIKALRVISRRSTAKYKEGVMTLLEIARELNVDGIIEPDIVAYGTSVKMEVRLISARSEERQLWSQSYERPASEVVSIFGDVAKAIADKSGVSLSQEEIRQFESASRVDPKAHEAYLRGMDHLYQGTENALNRAMSFFDQAVSYDSMYARAHMGKALTWGFRTQMGYVSMNESRAESRQSFEKALQLDSSLVEAHYLKAVTNTWGFWNWEAGEREFRRTIEMDPNHAEAMAYYAHFLNIMNRWSEAEIQMEKAMELEPYNAWVIGLYGMYLNHARQFQKAQTRLEEALKNESNPLSSPALWTIYHNTGKYEQAMAVAREVYTEKREYVAVEKLITGYQRGGYKQAMENVAEAFLAKRDTAFFPAWQLATLYTRSDNKEKAIYWLNQAFDEHDPNMPYISCDPIFDNIEAESGFLKLLAKMDLTRSH